MILLAAVVAVIAFGVVLVSALGLASRIRGSGVLVALGGALVVVVVVTGLGGLVVGIGFRGGETEPTPESTAGTTTSPATGTPTAVDPTVTTTTVPRAAIEGPNIGIVADSTDRFAPAPPLVDRLPARSVLRIAAAGFEPHGTGFVEQCTVAGCANRFPAVFDGNGMARFQYLVSNTFAAGLAPASTCRRDEPPCVVHVRSHGRSAFLTTFFRDAAPAPRRVTVEPSALELVDGARVRVSVSGFNPGERVQAMVCAAPDTRGSARCGAPGPVASFTIGAGGKGTTALEVRAGRVGSAGASCGRGTTCGIVVSQPRSSVPATVVPIVFAAGPSASYDFARTLAGLGVASVLFALAFLLVRSTDWRKPTEADTPDLDRAAFVDELR